jgi:hypothetical protein
MRRVWRCCRVGTCLSRHWVCLTPYVLMAGSIEWGVCIEAPACLRELLHFQACTLRCAVLGPAAQHWGARVGVCVCGCSHAWKRRAVGGPSLVCWWWRWGGRTGWLRSKRGGIHVGL